jgi:hypothetical protein
MHYRLLGIVFALSARIGQMHARLCLAMFYVVVSTFAPAPVFINTAISINFYHIISLNVVMQLPGDGTELYIIICWRTVALVPISLCPASGRAALLA